MSRLPRSGWSSWLVVGVVTGFLLAAAPAPLLGAKPPEGPPWLKLDRVEAEPSWIDGLVRLRVYVTAVQLSGGTIDIEGKNAWTLQVGSSKKKMPYVGGTFATIEDDLALTIVVCTTTGFAEELPAIKSALRTILEGLPKTTQVAVLHYGEEVEGDRRVGPLKAAFDTIDDLAAETTPSEPQLVKAVRNALKTFRKIKPSEPGRGIRQMLLVISDGQDIDHTPERFRAVARRADREGIRIHTLAYSRDNRRQPMLGLAEMSKLTYGTFRLARNQTSFDAQLASFAEEIQRQYVLTFMVEAEDVVGKRVKVLAAEMASNELKLKKALCGGETCASGQYCSAGACVTRATDDGRGILGWVLVVVGGAFGVLVLLVGVGVLLSRRERKREAEAALFAAIAEGEAAGPGVNRIAPQGPQGGPVAPSAPAAANVGRITGHAPGHQPAPPAPRAASLFMVAGDRQGQYIPVFHGFRIGKAPDCDLVLSDGFASSHHCHLELDKGGNVTLVDDRSTNGTFVNGVRASRNRLTHGMSIKIGQTELRFMQG